MPKRPSDVLLKGCLCMNKTELIEKISENTSLPKKKVQEIVDDALCVIVDTVASGEKVALSGFGTFDAKHRDARMGRNPKTNEEVPIPETTVPYFRAGNGFKDKVQAKAE